MYKSLRVGSLVLGWLYWICATGHLWDHAYEHRWTDVGHLGPGYGYGYRLSAEWRLFPLCLVLLLAGGMLLTWAIGSGAVRHRDESSRRAGQWLALLALGCLALETSLASVWGRLAEGGSWPFFLGLLALTATIVLLTGQPSRAHPPILAITSDRR